MTGVKFTYKVVLLTALLSFPSGSVWAQHSDSDLVYITPLKTNIRSASEDTNFYVTVGIINATPDIASIRIPLTFAGHPELKIDTTVTDIFGNKGIELVDLGANLYPTGWWSAVSSNLTYAEHICIAFASFDSNMPDTSGELVRIYFDLDSSQVAGQVVIDTVPIVPPCGALALVNGQAMTVLPQWQPATIRIGTVSDSDFVYLTPPEINISNAGKDTNFYVTLGVTNARPGIASIVAPLVFPGHPELRIDTTVTDIFGNKGIELVDLGTSLYPTGWWAVVSSNLTEPGKIGIGFTAFDSYMPDTSGELARIYFDLDSSGVTGQVKIDTGFLPPISGLALIDSLARTIKPRWQTATINIGTVGLHAETARPKSYTLAQNYPNPFNSGTAIRFSLEQPAEIELAVYNVLGRKVALLHRGLLSAGKHAVTWNGRTSGGRETASGVYFYRLTAAGRSTSRPMLLLR